MKVLVDIRKGGKSIVIAPEKVSDDYGLKDLYSRFQQDMEKYLDTANTVLFRNHTYVIEGDDFGVLVDIREFASQSEYVDFMRDYLP